MHLLYVILHIAFASVLLFTVNDPVAYVVFAMIVLDLSFIKEKRTSLLYVCVFLHFPLMITCSLMRDAFSFTITCIALVIEVLAFAKARL